MSLSLVVSGVGAVVAAIGIGMLLARCARSPRGDLTGWSVALLGLLISLVAQALGHLVGFGEFSFRAMEIGAQVIAPLALLAGLTELVATSVAGRFAGRLLIPALAFIALVILGTDPLSGAAFTKDWPPPPAYYQLIPNKLLEYGVAPLTLVVAVILVIIVAVRARQDSSWRAVLPAAAAIGVAILALALPGLEPGLANHLHLSLPLSSLFAVLCLVAAGLAWYAGTVTDKVPVSALRGAAAATAGRAGRAARDDRDDRRYDRAGHDPEYDAQYEVGRDRDGWGHGPSLAVDETGDFESYDGLYRDEPGGVRDGWTGQGDDYDSRELDAVYGYDSAVRDGYDTASLNGYDPDAVAAAAAAAAPAPGRQRPPDLASAAVDDRRPAASRAQLFGQIAIYTLIEDSVDEFDRLSERVVRQVRANEPDTLVFIVHAVPSAPMQRILYEVYRDRAAFDWHGSQPYVAEFEADRRPYVLATNVIELGLQQAKVSPFPSITELFGEPGYDTSGFERPDYTREYGNSAGGQNEAAW